MVSLRRWVVTAVVALATCTGGSSVCLAQGSISGAVWSPTPCHLEAAQADAMCSQVIQPVKAIVRLRSTAKGGRTVTVRTDDRGTFSASIPAGTYRTRIVSAATVEGRRRVYNPASLQITPSIVRITRRKITLDLVVSHISYGAPISLPK